MEVQATRIHQVLLMRYDEIPLVRLLLRSRIEQVAKLFEFSNTEVAADQSGKIVINANAGILHNESGECVITRLVIEERRVLLDVEGTTDDADRVFSRLRQFLSEIAEKEASDFLVPILKAEESEVVARMGFDAGSLVAPALLRFVDSNLVQSTNSDLTDSEIDIAQVSFIVQYREKGRHLDDYRISLSRKDFIIGPRPGFPLSERIYYSKAPVDTKTHLQLLSDLERTLVAR